MSHRTLVCAPEDPLYTAVLYEARLEHADPEEPLWRVPYFGQIVRVGTAEAIFADRKREHEWTAARKAKDLGFLAVIDRFGPEAMAWRIVSSETGPRTAMQELANAEEIRLINEHGGILRDMDAKLKQTLNLTKGGQGDARARWAAIDAKRRRACTKFKAAMEAYVEEHESALVPQAFVNEENYRLGEALARFRQGHMRKGFPEQASIEAWAESLPKWEWNAATSDERRAERSKITKETWKTMSTEARRARISKTRATKDAKTAEEKAAVSANQSTALRQPKVRAKAAQRKKDWWANISIDARSKILKSTWAKQRRAELEHARQIAVPFEKSKKRRAEMRAASEISSKKYNKNQLLYMISEDGATIRRVAKDGDVGKKFIVGPVVNPPATPETGPSDFNAYVSDLEAESD